MASFLTNAGALGLQNGTINWLTDTFKGRLVASVAAPNKDDLNMSGVAAIGVDQVIAGKTQTKDTAADRIIYDATDPVWLAVAIGAIVGWLIIYKFVANDAGSTPVFVLDIPDTPTNGSDMTVVFDAQGIMYSQQ